MNAQTHQTPSLRQNDTARRWLTILQPLTAAVVRIEKAIATLTQAGKETPQQAADTLKDLQDATRAAAEVMNVQMAADAAPAIQVQIIPPGKPAMPGKLAEAELHFMTGPLQGLKLIGFTVWERRTGNGRNVTFPARQYTVNGERRSFALLRPSGDARHDSQESCRLLILDAYERHCDQDRYTAPYPAPSRWQYDQDGRHLDTTPLQAPTTSQGGGFDTYADPIEPPTTTTQDQDPTVGQDDGRSSQQPPDDAPQARIGFMQQAAQAIQANPHLDPGTVIASAIVQATTPGAAGPMPPRPRRF